jgi:hypothetical protein
MMGSNWNRYNWRGHIIAQDFERAGWILSKRVTEWREQHGSE